MPAPTLWERFSLDPRAEANASFRASDRDRDVVTDVLGSAYAEGRLTREELDERAERTAAAKTLGELPPLVDDLVLTSSSPVRAASGSGLTDHRAEAERRYRDQRRSALFGFLTPTLICWVIWLAVLVRGGDAWFPWPAFVTIGTGMRFAHLVAGREDTIASIERHLAKRERRSLEAGTREE